MCDYSLHNVKSRPAKVVISLPRATLARAHEGSRHRKMNSSRSVSCRALSCPLTMRLPARRLGC